MSWRGTIRTVAWPVLVGLVGLRCFGLPVGVAAATGAVVLRPGSRWWRARRLAAAYDDELVRLLRGLARGLRSGAVLRVALAEVIGDVGGPLAADLTRLAADLDDGVVGALEGWAARRPRPSVRLAAGGLALGHATGGVTAAVVDTLADTIRLRLDGRDEAAALATQANVSALLLAGVPVLFLLAGVVTHSGASAFLLDEAAGRVCLVVGLVLDGVSLWVMVRMARSVLR